ncbi:lipase family protein [Nocardia sp. NPDC127579]|uniref:lipase family protein n=1 Tax=Nocardia sp. NPDC127579 TaxID=3345402 RepID=UPI003644DDAB
MWWRKAARSAAVVVVVLCVGGGAGAEAVPLEDLLTRPVVRDPATAMPTPLGDSFYQPPPGFEDTAPGTVLASRVGGIGLTLTPVTSTELLIRSTDSKDRPVAVVATLLVPQAPWPGPGPRPVVAFNVAIDSLGHTCAPSYQLRSGPSADLMAAQIPLAKNYAVLVTDHQGPRQAYAAGRMAGHAVLDSLRGAVGHPELGLRPDSPAVVTGYSGGAIASGWAAQLAPDYAPELELVGAVFGGVPADFELLLHTMNGRNAAAGVFLAAALGVAREYPDMMWMFNDNGWRLAQNFKNLCFPGEAALGAVMPVPAELLTDAPDPLADPVVQRMLADNRMGATAPRVPVYLYHGTHELWIPLEGAQRLYDDWCAHGVQVQFDVYPGEHIVAGALAIPEANAWIDRMLAGNGPNDCAKSWR